CQGRERASYVEMRVEFPTHADRGEHDGLSTLQHHAESKLVLAGNGGGRDLDLPGRGFGQPDFRAIHCIEQIDYYRTIGKNCAEMLSDAPSSRLQRMLLQERLRQRQHIEAERRNGACHPSHLMPGLVIST